MVVIDMKKRLLLAVLPALFVLSGCKSLYSAAATNVKTFVEDTVAHEEIFGEAKEGGYLGKAKNPYYLASLEKPKMAYQIKYDDKTDSLAIRFVAAIKNTNVVATWKRGVAGADGSELRGKSFSNDGQIVRKYYTAITDGNSPLEVGKGGEFNSYAGFVVYTIAGIPYEGNQDAYVAAYLNIEEDGNGSNQKQSDVLVVRIEKENDYTSKHAFTFNPANGEYFLHGKINGTTKICWADNPTVSGEYLASYSGIELKPNDYFGSFCYNGSSFKYFGYDAFCGGCTSYLNKLSDGFITPYVDGEYDILLENGYVYGENYMEVNVLSSYVYFNFLPMANGGTNGRVWNEFYCYAFNSGDNSDNNDSWPGVKMTEVNANGLYKTSIRASHDRIIFNNNGDQSDHMIQTNGNGGEELTYDLTTPMFACTSKDYVTAYALDASVSIDNSANFDYYLHTSRNSWTERTKEYGFEKTNDPSQYLLRCYFNNGDQFGIKDNNSGWWAGNNLQGEQNGWWNDSGNVRITVDDWYNIYFKPGSHAIYMSRG